LTEPTAFRRASAQAAHVFGTYNCALTTPIPILLRRDGPVPRHEHRGNDYHSHAWRL